MKRQRGFALGYVLSITMVGLIYLFFIATNSIYSLSFAARHNRVRTAIYTAQSGNNRALFALESSDPAIPVGCNKSTTYITNQRLSNSSTIISTAVITNYDPHNVCLPVIISDGTILLDTYVYIKSVGQMGLTQQTVHQLFDMQTGVGNNGNGKGNSNCPGNQGNSKLVGKAGNGPCIYGLKWWR